MASTRARRLFSSHSGQCWSTIAFATSLMWLIVIYATSGDDTPRHAACCARAPSGHAAAVPLSSVMNSRRFTDHLVGVPQERLRNGEADRGAGNRVASVDDLICSHQYCCRYCQTECFQGLLVNHKAEAGWLLEWEIGGVRSS